VRSGLTPYPIRFPEGVHDDRFELSGPFESRGEILSGEKGLCS